MAVYKRPQFVDVDNAVRVPGKKAKLTAEASQRGQPVNGNIMPIGEAGPNGKVAAQPYKASQLGVRDGNPIASTDMRQSALRGNK